MDPSAQRTSGLSQRAPTTVPETIAEEPLSLSNRTLFLSDDGRTNGRLLVCAHYNIVCIYIYIYIIYARRDVHVIMSYVHIVQSGTRRRVRVYIICSAC